jgi:ABC-2 type transport system ATP-binding protein
MNDAVPAVEINGLSKMFGATEALAPTHLSVPHGSVFALVGHNGAGKTTLLKLLLNIIPPTAGQATVFGESTHALRADSFTHIGYVSENQEMPDWMTVRGFMDYLRPFYPVWDEGTLLADLQLPPDRKLKHLSRGMRMKAALASVLAFQPSLIVMDEPFSGLDPLVRDQLIRTLLDRIAAGYANGNAPTVIISSHDLAEIESFATHVAFLHGGRLLFAEPMETLIARFRDVSITFDDEPGNQIPATLPASWILAERGRGSLHFIHTEADLERLEDQVSALLPGGAAIEVEAMDLRNIFLALVKSGAPSETERRAA